MESLKKASPFGILALVAVLVFSLTSCASSHPGQYPTASQGTYEEVKAPRGETTALEDAWTVDLGQFM